MTHYPDSERGGDQAALKVSYCYEPVYNQIWKVTEERGNASGYTPPNGGSASAARYTTEYIPDYFEGGLDTAGCSCGHTLRQMLDKFDISIASVQDQLNQGDLNEDGSYNICGNIIMIRYPTVQLRPDSPQIAREGGQYQQIVIRRSFNKYGQYDWVETPEGEVTLFTYYPESDPEGDGQNIRSGNNNSGQPFDTMTGGYLKDTIRDHHLGHTRRLYYDSRNLVIKTSDAQGPEQPDPLGRYTAGNINADGNVTQIVHDGLGRSIQTIQELRLSGQGGNELDLSNPGNPDGKIIESTSYDANSRVAAVADDKGNATAYAYDSQNRLVLTTFADGSGKSIEYNADSQPIRTVDNNGNIILASFDSLGRVVRRDITPAAGVKGTTVQTFEYDGLSRVTKAGDNNDPANSSDDSLVQRRYDSLGRLLEESQNGKVVSYNWSQTADPVDLTYPNGRKIEYSLDQLNRLRTIKNSGSSTTIAAYDYIGNRLIERVHANGTRLTTLNDAGTINQGYDGLGRLTQMRHLKDNTLIAGFGYGYNRENIKSYRQDLKYPHLSELYHYDSRYRLVDFQRGALNASKDGITGAAINSQTWQFDGVGNWASTVVDGQSQTQTISNMNAYLSFAGVTQTYDTNGNLTNDGNLTFAYDFANRMVEIRDNEDNSLIASYSYDAFNRRISKNIQSTTVSQGDTSGSEYQSDRRTIALYHFNNSSGPIVDSSGNGNDAGPRKRITTVAGLYGTNAAGFSGKRLTAPASSSLDSITDKLTVEAWVYIQPGDGEVKCRLVHRQESFILKIRKDTAKAVFKVFIDQGPTEPIIARAVSDSAIPMQTWVHLAGVYNGKKVKLFVNGVKQRKKTAITGNVHRLPDARLVLGSQNFHGRLEEVRISNKARRGFPGASTSSQQVLRHFFYAGWTCIEEREQAVLDGGSFGPEKLTRQFVDGANIDEHICVDYYADDDITVAKTYFYHANHRGDIVALTDVVGTVVLELRCSAYGQAAKVDQQGLLQEFDDFSLVVFGFQRRRLDEESFLYHFRSRQYNPVTGRFCQRDGLGYVDGYNLYLAFRDNPSAYRDPDGLEPEDPNMTPWAKYGLPKYSSSYAVTALFKPKLNLSFSIGLRWQDRLWTGFPTIFAPGYQDINDQISAIIEKEKNSPCPRKITILTIYGHSGAAGTVHFQDLASNNTSLVNSMSFQTDFSQGAIDFLKNLRNWMAPDGIIILYQCGVGRGRPGTILLTRIAALTNTKIKAPLSAFTFGESPLGGSPTGWKTAYPTGHIEVEGGEGISSASKQARRNR